MSVLSDLTCSLHALSHGAPQWVQRTARCGLECVMWLLLMGWWWWWSGVGSDCFGVQPFPIVGPCGAWRCQRTRGMQYFVSAPPFD